MKTLRIHLLCLCAAFIFACTSCKKDEVVDPVIPNEEEVITTLQYTLSPVGGGTDIVLSFVDMDGDGPEDPTITVSNDLSTNTLYNGSLLLLNETESPIDTVNLEILDEAEEHQFFFVSDVADISVTYADMDADMNPIGLSSIVSTGSASNGTLSVILRHEPDKDAAGVAAGDITNAGGETDIEATFDVVIQ